ncbi:tumor necrosis factor receptor superfamily member 14-like isoform X4 [Xyrichtys novacula]|uniref:Tumor necrosis factor receptor superfamily member 5 n=1 Tax=Xyrichtys novacula TaxID=13765 RepID=A0AAV1F1U7_XYRNO|nr:tumor necrosis factor receptor superfamily member 14-like isoform X4 [Xyrichtys novacula]
MREKLASAAAVLMLLLVSLCGQTLSCDPNAYLANGVCCLKCPPGHRVLSDCDLVTRRRCVPCLNGAFMDQLNGFSRCNLCKSCDPASGLRVKSFCTRVSNTFCEPLKTFVCTKAVGDDCVTAERRGPCRPGQYIKQKATGFDCSPCPAGTFSDGSFSACRLHTRCIRLNLPLLRRGTNSSDAFCGDPPQKRRDWTHALIWGVVSIVVALISAVSGYLIYRNRGFGSYGESAAGNTLELQRQN